MQRALVISFSIFYAFLSTGIALNPHSCEGQCEKFLIDLDSDDCRQDPSSCPAKSAEEDCCENQPVILRFSPQRAVFITRGLDPSNFRAEASSLTTSPDKSFTSSPPSEVSQYLTIPLWLAYCNLTYYS